MNFELHILSNFFKSQNPEIAIKKILDAGDIFMIHKDKMDWILNFQAKYGNYPNYNTFFEKWRIELPNADDNISYYIDKAKEFVLFHQLSSVYDSLGIYLREGKIKEAMSLLQTESMALASKLEVGRDVDYAQTIEDRLIKYYERQNNKRVFGIPSGWDVLDTYTTGWQPATYTVLFSKSKSYKTWILLQWALQAYKMGYFVVFFSREMTAFQLFKRLDSLLMGTPYSYFKYGFPSKEVLDNFVEDIQAEVTKSTGRFLVLDQSGSDEKPEIDFLYHKVATLKPDIVFVDGIYLIQGKGVAEWERVKFVSNRLKQMSIQLNVPVVGTTQATRSSKGGDLKKGDVGSTVAFEQDCDLLLAINRMVDSVKEKIMNELVIRSIASREGEDIALKVTPDFDKMYFSAEAMQEEDIIETPDYDMPF